MSTEEQDAAIGRLVRERADANRQRVLIEDEVGRINVKVSNLWGHLSGVSKQEQKDFARSIEIVDELISFGGLERLKALLSEHAILSERIEQIAQTLRKAGTE